MLGRGVNEGVFTALRIRHPAAALSKLRAQKIRRAGRAFSMARRECNSAGSRQESTNRADRRASPRRSYSAT